MKTVIEKSFIFAVFAIFGRYFLVTFLGFDRFLDRSEVQSFLSTFGTLYGIMTAFVIVQVWQAYNKNKELIEKEALGLERLYRLTLYFRDQELTKQMFRIIREYAKFMIKNRFKNLSSGNRSAEAGRIFRKFATVIKDIKFDDDHDSIVFHHVVDHFGRLSETRSERIKQSLSRLPDILRLFLYLTSFIVLGTFILIPSTGLFYWYFAVGLFGFILGMIFQLVEGLNNPFSGHFVLTPEPFERTLKHIEEDY